MSHKVELNLTPGGMGSTIFVDGVQMRCSRVEVVVAVDQATNVTLFIPAPSVRVNAESAVITTLDAGREDPSMQAWMRKRTAERLAEMRRLLLVNALNGEA